MADQTIQIQNGSDNAYPTINLEELQFYDDEYNYLRVIRLGKIYDVTYIRKQVVANTTACYSINPSYAPSIVLSSLDFFKQNSGYAIVSGKLKTNGEIALYAAQYDEPVAGSFHWTYSK